MERAGGTGKCLPHFGFAIFDLRASPGWTHTVNPALDCYPYPKIWLSVLEEMGISERPRSNPVQNLPIEDASPHGGLVLTPHPALSHAFAKATASQAG